MIKKLFSYLLYIFYLLIIVCVGLEIFLRFYSPIEVRISSGKVILPKNQKYILPNKNFTKLSQDAVHNKNSWGFRGEDWNPDSDRTRLLFIGGSTTECFYTDDSKVWVAQYANKIGDNFLVNNGGLNGHSSVGHITLLTDYIKEIKPNYVFFLVGINDVAVTENGGNAFDNKISGKGIEGLLLKIEQKSRLLNLLHSFYRSYQAKKMDLADNMEWVLADKKSKYQLTDTEKTVLFKKHEAAQTEYADRLLKLIEICKSVKAKPVFITQPLLFGKGIDPITGLDLESFSIYGLTGTEYFKKLSFYNETMKKVAAEKDISLIDLASLLPHNSKYYIDDMHFSDAGAEKIAEILYNKVEFDTDKELHIKE